MTKNRADYEFITVKKQQLTTGLTEQIYYEVKAADKREGFICQLFQADEEDKMIAEWVIDPDLALPLRSKIFEDNELQAQFELVKYMQY